MPLLYRPRPPAASRPLSVSFLSLGALVASACAALCAASATAQTAPGANVDLQVIRAPVDASGPGALLGVDALAHGELSLGLTTVWSRRPLALADGYRVDHVVTPTLAAGLGLGLGPLRAQLALSVPFPLVSGRAAPNSDVRGQGLGDISIDVKVPLLPARRGALGVALRGRVRLPTATADATWSGEDGVGWEGGAIGEARSAGGRWRGLVNLGLRMRSGDAAVGTMNVGHSVPLSAGIGYSPAPGVVEVFAEAHADLAFDDRGRRPSAGLAGLKVYLASRSYLTLAAGAQLDGDRDLRGLVSIVFEPRAGAARGRVDDAPDGRHTMLFAPPPPDAHAPPDAADAPEKDAEGLVAIGDSSIEILEKIHFEYDSAVIRRDSYRILDAVAFALADNPGLRLVEIRGHTDSRGSARYNLALSERRARAVRTYLIAAGVAPTRLAARGFGESRPRVAGDHERAWAANRRVEFAIVDRADR